MPGLTSAGTGIDFAGSSRDASVASSALARSGVTAIDPTVSDANMMVNLFEFISVLANNRTHTSLSIAPRLLTEYHHDTDDSRDESL
jgi:hypothetical protein